MPNLLCFFGIYCWRLLFVYTTWSLHPQQDVLSDFTFHKICCSVCQNFLYFQKSVAVSVVIVFKIKELKNMEEAITCHRVWIQCSAVLSGPIIFEAVMLIMSHLNYKSKKWVHFFDCNISWLCWSASSILDDIYWWKQQFVSVRIIWKICLKKQNEDWKGRRFCTSIGGSRSVDTIWRSSKIWWIPSSCRPKCNFGFLSIIFIVWGWRGMHTRFHHFVCLS